MPVNKTVCYEEYQEQKNSKVYKIQLIQLRDKLNRSL